MVKKREKMFGNVEINIEPVEGLNPETIHGVDLSSIISLERSGVNFYNENNEKEDIFKILSRAGVNYIRVRIWNDPYDSQGNGYGGGTNDLKTAIQIGKRATENNMKLFVDFHYSDFWADPGSQRSPKAWEKYSLEEKKKALYDFTVDCLHEFNEGSVDIGMVQIGNETNFGMSGEVEWDRITQLFKAGSKAVREATPEAKVVLHFADPQTEGLYYKLAHILDINEVDYDVFASSYYPFWHGTLENVTSLLKHIAKRYNKKVMIAETAYPWTFESGDGHKVMISPEDVTFPYPVSLKGQADALRDVYKIVANVGKDALGVFYWEPAWIPIGPSEQIDENKKMWEKFGSGWASSYSVSYNTDSQVSDDPQGDSYGGSTVDNQAFFDFNGYPTPVMKLFKAVQGKE